MHPSVDRPGIKIGELIASMPVAKWIVNWFQKSWPHETVMRLRAQSAKPDIVDHPRLKQVMTDKGYFN